MFIIIGSKNKKFRATNHFLNKPYWFLDLRWFPLFRMRSVKHCHAAPYFKTMLCQHNLEETKSSTAQTAISTPRCPGNCSSEFRRIAVASHCVFSHRWRTSLVYGPLICVIVRARDRTCVCSVCGTTCCRGNSNCLFYADSQWERGGQSGVFLPTQGHLQHSYRPGRQTCKWVTDCNPANKQPSSKTQHRGFKTASFDHLRQFLFHSKVSSASAYHWNRLHWTGKCHSARC